MGDDWLMDMDDIDNMYRETHLSMNRLATEREQRLLKAQHYLMRERNERYLKTEEGYYQMGWRCGGSCDYLSVNKGSLRDHRCKKNCSGTKEEVMLYVNDPGDLKVINQSRIR